MANYKDLSKDFFNASTGANHRAWADSAAAYFNSLTGKSYGNYAEAMAHYYANANAATQTIVFDDEVVTGVTVTGTGTTATFTVVGGQITAIALS